MSHTRLFRPLTTRERRRLVALVVLMAGALPLLSALYGCGGEQWRYTHQSLPARYVEVSGYALQLLCRGMNGAQWAIYHGCAQRDYGNQVCWIYTEPNPPAWLRDHEEKHCQGWSHP